MAATPPQPQQQQQQQPAGPGASSCEAPKIPPQDMSKGIDLSNISIDVLLKNMYSFIFGYTEGPMPIYDQKVVTFLLRNVRKILDKEPTVLDLKAPINVVGPIHGEGDSLVTLIACAGKPPEKKWLFLGNYVGHGFAPHETLFIAMALKIKYPDHVYLLKGYHEEPEVLKALEFQKGLEMRQIGEPGIWNEITETLSVMPLAAVLDGKILCMQGGPGAYMREVGVARLRSVKKPPANVCDARLHNECLWSALVLKGGEVLRGKDGMPTFTEDEVAAFVKKNGLKALVRGRQLVEGGFLNRPKEMITLSSAVAFLDNFRNCAAVLFVKKDSTESCIVRYKMLEEEAQSLDDIKPPAGRNAIAPS